MIPCQSSQCQNPATHLVRSASGTRALCEHHKEQHERLVELAVKPSEIKARMKAQALGRNR